MKGKPFSYIYNLCVNQTPVGFGSILSVGKIQFPNDYFPF